MAPAGAEDGVERQPGAGPVARPVELGRYARRTSEHETLDAAGIAALEPDLGDRFSRGLFFAREAHVDPRQALPALAARLLELGGTILLGQADQPAGSFAYVVDCRGFGGREWLPGLRGVRGEMLLLRCPDVVLHRPVRLLHPRFPIYIVPRDDHVFMLGATMIESEERGPPRLRSMMELLGAAYALHPAFAEAGILEIAADLRPSFDDNMPRIVRDGAVVRVNGMFRHGFLMAPALAADVADLLLDERRPPAATPILPP